MYTNTSKFRVKNGYGTFTIPKDVLADTCWKPGDLIGFLGKNGTVIHLQRVCTKENLQRFKKEGKIYNKKFFKKISKFGGKTGTLGIKSFPDFLLREFNPKKDSTIYFVPANRTWLNEITGSRNMEEIVFIAFDPKHLKSYDIHKKEDAEKLEKEYRNRIIDMNRDNYDFRLFHGKYEHTEKNSDRAKKNTPVFNKALSRDKIIILEKRIGEFEESLKEIISSNHPQKKFIIKDLRDSIKRIKLIIRKLKKNPEKIFKEWSKEEIKQSKQNIIKRRRNNKNLSSA